MECDCFPLFPYLPEYYPQLVPVCNIPGVPPPLCAAVCSRWDRPKEGEKQNRTLVSAQERRNTGHISCRYYTKLKIDWDLSKTGSKVLSQNALKKTFALIASFIFYVIAF